MEMKESGRAPRTQGMAGLPEGDDGRTIADMNVDGMPWRRTAADGEGRGAAPGGEPLTPQQQRMYTWAALKAGLLVALVFGAVFFLFIAFCDFVWFR